MASMLAADTGVLSIGLHPRSLDFSTLPDGVDEAVLTARIERGNAALREAGFDVVLCQVDTSPDNIVDALRRWIMPRP